MCSILETTRQVSYSYTLVALGISQIRCDQRLGWDEETGRGAEWPFTYITCLLIPWFQSWFFHYWLLTFKVKNWEINKSYEPFPSKYTKKPKLYLYFQKVSWCQGPASRGPALENLVCWYELEAAEQWAGSGQSSCAHVCHCVPDVQCFGRYVVGV